MTTKLIGTGSYLPSHKVSNRDLFSKIQNFDDEKARNSLSKKGVDVENCSTDEVFDLWVRQVCGIQNRHFVGSDLLESEYGAAETMAYFASKEAIEDAGINPDEIDAVVAASFTAQNQVPNLSIAVSKQLGLTDVGGFVLNTACSGFLDAIGAAQAKIAANQADTVLVVASECLTPHINFSDPTTAILFGDGAGAAIVTRADENETGLNHYTSFHEYNAEHIFMESGKKLEMGGGPNVQRQAVMAMSKALNASLEKSELAVEDLDMVIPHQANLRIITQLAKRIKVPIEKFGISIEQTGNVSCATIPITLDLVRKGKIPSVYEKGNCLIGFTSVGGGYTFSGLTAHI